MQRPNYKIPTNPVYNPDIPALLDSDPASATNTFNPPIQKLVDNTQAVHDLAMKNAGTTKTLELHNTDPNAHADLFNQLSQSNQQLQSHIGAGGIAHASAVADGEAGFMTGADKSKLDGIPANADANPAVMSQAVAEAGTSTTVQSVTAQRLRQAANSAITAANQNGELSTSSIMPINFTIPANLWTAGSVAHEGFEYEARLNIEGLTPIDLITAYFDRNSVQTGEKAGVDAMGDTELNLAIFYAIKQPETDMSGKYVIFKGVS